MSKDYTVQLEAPPAIIERDSTRSDVVRQRLQQIDSTVTLSTFERGDLFAEIKANSYWRDWRFESFPEYLKASGFDISPRQADYEVVISNVSKELKINATSKAKAKNSKLNVIFTLDHNKVFIDPATQNETKMSDVIIDLVEQAPHNTLVWVKEEVKRLKRIDATEEDIASELTWVNAPIRRDAKQIFDDAIEKIMKFNGCTIDTMTKELKDISKGAALEKMAADTLADPNYDVDESDEEGIFEDSIEDEVDDTHDLDDEPEEFGDDEEEDND